MYDLNLVPVGGSEGPSHIIETFETLAACEGLALAINITAIAEAFCTWPLGLG